MAKSKGSAKLFGPLYTSPTGKNLGPHEVHGPKGGMSFPDPLGFIKHGSGGSSTDNGKGKKAEKQA
jgi:hypothetical protein